jgi:DNA-directed RNA polymerase omega subunit
MKKITLSRGPGIDTEKCVEMVGNKFDLVLIASARAREIRRQNKDSNKREHVHTVIPALEEIQAGKIGREYLKKVR